MSHTDGAATGVRHVHGDPLSVDSSQVGVFEEGDEISLGSLLECHDSRRLKTEVGLHDEQ